MTTFWIEGPGVYPVASSKEWPLGRALLSRPKILLLDEPFSALDRPLRNHVAARLRDHVEGAGPASSSREPRRGRRGGVGPGTLAPLGGGARSGGVGPIRWSLTPKADSRPLGGGPSYFEPPLSRTRANSSGRAEARIPFWALTRSYSTRRNSTRISPISPSPLAAGKWRRRQQALQSPSLGRPTDPALTKLIPSIVRCHGLWVCPKTTVSPGRARSLSAICRENSSGSVFRPIHGVQTQGVPWTRMILGPERWPPQGLRSNRNGRAPRKDLLDSDTCSSVQE